MHERISPARPFSADQTALMKKIKQETEQSGIKAVNFRMEDILVITPFSEKSDMFMLMEEQFRSLYIGKKSFTELRLQAEAEAVKKCGITATVTLAMIYDILMKQSKITEDSRDALMRREVELIVYFSYPRRCGTELFGAARRKKKKIIVTADTVYPRSVIVKILSHCGFETCNELIVTSELPAADRMALFETVLKKAGVSAEKLMNIGSDIEADVEKPIMQGSKALLVNTEYASMLRSGKLRGFVEQKCLYSYDSPDYLALHCAFGIYSDYGFDIPQGKQPHSDFCNDLYMLGFMVLGPLTLIRDFKPEGDVQTALLRALEECRETTAGREDFVKIFRSHFADFIDKFGYKGCELPFLFLTKYSSVGDRMMLEKHLSALEYTQWNDITEEPDIAPVHRAAVKASFTQKLADKMFPRGTRVRILAEEALGKMKGKIFRG